jgi:hypothetical protein
MKNEETAVPCPNCGMMTARVIVCSRCNTEGCVEFCIPAGVGAICAKCESEDD